MIVSVYVLIPVFMKSGLLFGEAYLFCFYFPFILLFAGSVIMLKYEKITFDWNSISERLRLRRFDKKTVLWTIAFLVLISFGYASASLIGKYIAQNIPILSPSEFMPGGLNPNKVMQPGHFFDVPLSGKWWLAIVYFIGWFFNIFGEEFMFRGILLPIDEKSFGGKAWIFQGILWGVWHVFWLWIFIPLILFVSLPLLYVVQKMKNTWISIIIHGSLNIIPLIYIIKEIIR
jgi:membrane protease YdiL (CAAX protease family)